MSTRLLSFVAVAFGLLAGLVQGAPTPDGLEARQCTLAGPTAQPASWMLGVKHQGISPFNGDSSYKVFRNVKDYGAVGDGVHDDTAAIQAAITAGNRCGANCNAGSSTLTPALVFFPAGVYLISSPIVQYYYTQLVGDATHPPTLKASSAWTPNGKNYVGIYAMVDSDPYVPNGNGANWYQNQNNFFRQIRNFIFDMTAVPAGNPVTGIHWQVAQATSLTNIVFNMAAGAASQHQGIWMENGSGGWMADLTFNGGKFGMWVGNQQFTNRNLVFNNCQTGVYLNWDWTWSFKDLQANNCQIGVDMSSSNLATVTLIDGKFANTAVAVLTASSLPSANPTASKGTLILDNVQLTSVGVAVKLSSNGATLLGGGSTTITRWGQGRYYAASSSATTVNGNFAPGSKPASLLSGNRFFTRARPEYEGYPASAFVSVKDFGAKGDGRADDTAALQSVINNNAGCKIIYIPAGTYLVTSTLFVPVNTRIVGEAWSTLMGTGSAFSSASNPTPVVRVGNSGDQGLVELSDLIISTRGPAPGALLVQWNVHERSGHQGEAGMWDVQFRVGGAAGTNLQAGQCQITDAVNSGSTANPACIGAWGHMHITSKASGYFENVWMWTADHDMDGGAILNIYSGRGLLVNSAGPVWLLGTAAEHNTLYQYQLSSASNVFASMIQTETPYMQGGAGSVRATAPSAPNAAYGDPTYSNCGSSNTCAMSWSLRVVNSSGVWVYGAGMYSFFNNHGQNCLASGSFCQDALVSVENNSRDLHLFVINTIGAKNLLVSDSGVAVAQSSAFTVSSTAISVAGVLGVTF
ncbi:hypothetical protein HK101_011499 [Irineochytrium annulatum]|nr:hypothetical protein HK101_011499 [Irineochytrium annulatum]